MSCDFFLPKLILNKATENPVYEARHRQILKSSIFKIRKKKFIKAAYSTAPHKLC